MHPRVVERLLCSAFHLSSPNIAEDEAAKNDQQGLKTPPEEALATLNRRLSESFLDVLEATLTTSLGPGPVTYVSRAHAVEFELQAGSLDEELPVEVTISQGLAFVDCRTEEGSGR